MVHNLRAILMHLREVDTHLEHVNLTVNNDKIEDSTSHLVVDSLIRQFQGSKAIVESWLHKLDKKQKRTPF